MSIYKQNETTGELEVVSKGVTLERFMVQVAEEASKTGEEVSPCVKDIMKNKDTGKD